MKIKWFEGRPTDAYGRVIDDAWLKEQEEKEKEAKMRRLEEKKIEEYLLLLNEVRKKFGGYSVRGLLK